MRRDPSRSFFALLACALGPGCLGSDGSDSGADDTDGDPQPEGGLVERYEHVEQLHLVPNETGQAFGMSECDMEIGATLAQVPDAETCPDCEAFYRGPIGYSYTDCSGASVDGDFLDYGLAWEAGGLRVWTFDPKGGQWTDEGVASPQGGGLYQLVSTELIGDKSFSLGEATVTMTFQEL